MLLPKRNDFSLFDDIFEDSFFLHAENRIMKTDIKENKDSYSIVIDLPGVNKEDIEVDILEGYLNIHVVKKDSIQDNENGKYVRRERYFGESSRSFYVGESVSFDEVDATFKNGVLYLEIPKKEEKIETPEKKYIEIHD